ncbi:MAG: carbohydrate ABC transporter permease [Firmicutes bacterium]|nr:carbohydrate ABC transporter permease [Bacillota bacterium]
MMTSQQLTTPNGAVKVKKKSKVGSTILTILFAIVCVGYILPIILVLINSFKLNSAINTDTFALPNGETFVGLDNYIKGATFGNYPFYKSLLYSLVITLISAFLILLCTSMSAWYISRVGSRFTKIFYFACVFSMIVPFQMVMFPLVTVATDLRLNTPWTIPIIYLGFGAGLAVFMFTGFVKSLPLEIEEAAAIDGCGPIRTFFMVVLPMLKPTLISVGILEVMWVWNDYLLPTLVLDINKYKTIPIHVQYLQGSYGSVDLGATMAVMMFSLLPIIIVYLFCQKHIIKGVAAGAVKG